MAHYSGCQKQKTLTTMLLVFLSLQDFLPGSTQNGSQKWQLWWSLTPPCPTNTDFFVHFLPAQEKDGDSMLTFSLPECHCDNSVTPWDLYWIYKWWNKTYGSSHLTTRSHQWPYSLLLTPTLKRSLALRAAVGKSTKFQEFLVSISKKLFKP